MRQGYVPCARSRGAPEVRLPSAEREVRGLLRRRHGAGARLAQEQDVQVQTVDLRMPSCALEIRTCVRNTGPVKSASTFRVFVCLCAGIYVLIQETLLC